MKEPQIRSYIAHLGATQITKTGQWIKVPCIFAPWTHDGGVDKSPSAGISIKESDPSNYHCFSCGIKGDLFDTAMELRTLTADSCPPNINFKEAIRLATDEENDKLSMDFDFPDFDDLKAKGLEYFPEDWFMSFPSALSNSSALSYLESRQVPLDVIKELKCRFDTARKRICFPIRVSNGKLVGMQGRIILPNVEPRYYMYPHPEKKGPNGTQLFNPSVWFGEEWINATEPLVITEGVFDLAKIKAVYPNVVACLTTAITPEKAKRLGDPPVIISFFDTGVGGDKGRSLIDKYWKTSYRIHITPEGFGDAGAMPVEVIDEWLQEVLL